MQRSVSIRPRCFSFSVRPAFLTLRLLTIFLVTGTAGWCSAQEKRLEYNRDIRPILADACFACHGPDSAARKADLRLDLRENAIDMKAISPGDPAASELLKRILTDDEHEQMPPPETKKVLTEEQKQTLKDWIQQGAEYQLHWSFITPKKPVLPEIADPRWSQNPIDRFIRARLEQEQMTPSTEADRRTLARRLSLDLTGLPPAPEVVEEFVNDKNADAYEKLVDRFLASTDWGEHRGRYWLDYARFADTHGIHFDNYREMWSYRDWVISAFNRNMPFDQFTIENLAGDLLPNATLEQKIASGFNRCNMTTNEGGIIDEEYLVLYTRDRTETTAQVWMGLTAGCAVCHTHKFDPISHQEFYELAAFFNNTTQAAKDGNIPDTPPVIMVPSPADEIRWQALTEEIAATKRDKLTRKQAALPEFEKWAVEDSATVFTTPHSDALALHAPFNVEGKTAAVTVAGQQRELPVAENAEWEAGPDKQQAVRISKTGAIELPEIGDFDSDQPFTISAWVKAPANDNSGALVARMDPKNEHRGWDLWIEGRRLGTHIIHSWPENAIKVVTRKQIPANKWTHVAVSYDGSKKAVGVKIFFNGQLQDQVLVSADKLTETTKTPVPLKIGQRNTGAVATGVAIQDLRLYEKRLTPEVILVESKARAFAAQLKLPAEKRDAKTMEELLEWWLQTHDARSMELTQRLSLLQKEESEIRGRGTIAHIMQEKPDPAMAFILNRGEYDQRLNQVTPNTPAILPPFPKDVPRNRLTFAKWLLQPDQPLTARVTVNRFWQEIFGTGLVKTSGDFGVMGELPSHPELLDWLALDFVEHGWDVKRFFKQIVRSATYRQSSAAPQAKWDRDPENRLLARGPRFRMDAEMVRDYALASSGALVRQIGGPSVKPYQPEGIWEIVGMPGSTTRNYKQDSGESLYRRSMYTFVKRMAPPPSLEIFNSPNREFCVVRRERTNTPSQALVTLNDEQFVEAARIMAQNVIRQAGADTSARLKVLGERLLARDFRAEEREVLLASLSALQAHYDQHPDDAGKLIEVGESTPDAGIPANELAAWTMLCNEVMNLDEVLNK